MDRMKTKPCSASACTVYRQKISPACALSPRSLPTTMAKPNWTKASASSSRASQPDCPHPKRQRSPGGKPT